MTRRPGGLAILFALAACGDVAGPDAGPDGPDPDGAGALVPCANGSAGGFPCSGVDLLAHIPLHELDPTRENLTDLTDVWGWTDPDTGDEYALVGRDDGLAIVNVTDPVNPVPVGHLPSAAPPSGWRDVKVYADHAFVVADGAPGHGIQVLDLTRLRGLAEFTVLDADAHYTEVSSVHNIAINEETGFAYSVGNNTGGTTCGGGLHMIDVRTPKSPSFEGCFAEPGTGQAGTGYTHDAHCVVYRGPDADHAGREICVGSNETVVVIADVTDKDAPALISIGSYPDYGYVHQGWLSEDHRYFFQDDEADELMGNAPRTRMLVWDVTDLDDPVVVTEHFGPTGATDHNLYVSGDLVYHSNYAFGIRVIDVSDPETPFERGFFDTHPDSDDPSFRGSWSNYPFFDSGTIVVTSAREGLFLLRLQP